jgi:DNA/RNA endonuclease G (NUC1)
MVTIIRCFSTIALLVAGTVAAQSPDDAYDYAAELQNIGSDLKLGKEIDTLEQGSAEIAAPQIWSGIAVRSRHLLFGLPRLTDKRYDAPGGAPGISLVVREGFVIAYSDVLHCPIWVAQRWTTRDHAGLDRAPALKRDWREDPDLAAGLRIGTSYAGNDTGLDRGHMARHEMNRAWGLDASIEGCLISNSVPQHKDINRGPVWRELEDAIRDRVAGDGSDSEDSALWIISGALFQDTNNPGTEAPDADLKKAAMITTGFRVPYATFKIVTWFDGSGAFQARGYVFEQPYTTHGGQPLSDADFAIPPQDRGAKEFITPIDKIEARAGVDFFPLLKDSIETPLESATPATLW